MMDNNEFVNIFAKKEIAQVNAKFYPDTRLRFDYDLLNRITHRKYINELVAKLSPIYEDRLLDENLYISLAKLNDTELALRPYVWDAYKNSTDYILVTKRLVNLMGIKKCKKSLKHFYKNIMAANYSSPEDYIEVDELHPLVKSIGRNRRYYIITGECFRHIMSEHSFDRYTKLFGLYLFIESCMEEYRTGLYVEDQEN